MRSITGTIAALFLFLQPLALSAQDLPEEPLQPFLETIDVNVVNVEVFVTDKAGNRVTGLKKEDFELYEDGRPVAVTNFYAVENGRPVGDEPGLAEAPESGSQMPDRRIQLNQREVPESQRLYLIIYVDNLFLKPFNRNKVARQVRTFLRTKLLPEDEVMLVTFDKSLHKRHDFTTNRQAIIDALFGIEELTGYAVQKDTARRETLRRLDMAEDALEAESHVDFYAKQEYDDAASSIRHLQEIVTSLGGLTGRKALLYVSDGLPMTAAEDLFYLLDIEYQDEVGSGRLRASRYSLRSAFRRLTASANANRVMFYTLEAAGLRSHASLSAEYGGRGGQQLTDGSYAEVDFVRVTNTTEPLQMLAHDTGGQATFSTNNFAGALDRMADDFKNYYSLGYQSGDSIDGRYHRIEVRVKRKGLEVRHRAGYRGKTAETRVAEGTLASLLYGVEANPLDVTIRIKPGRVREDGRYLVPVDVRIPIGNVALIPHESIHQGKVRVSVAVIDEKGRMSPVEQQPLPITVPEADLEVARDKYFTYSVELLMRRGFQNVAVGVRDDVAGQVSFIRRGVEI